MKFSTREDIEAPIEYVFERVTDFTNFERQAMRRGGEVTRLDKNGDFVVGSSWDVNFMFRNKGRNLKAEIAKLETPTALHIGTSAKSLDGVTIAELVALSRTKTRLTVTLELSPKNLSARLFLQSLKLAKSNLSRKFKQRVSEFTNELEITYQKNS